MNKAQIYRIARPIVYLLVSYAIYTRCYSMRHQFPFFIQRNGADFSRKNVAGDIMRIIFISFFLTKDGFAMRGQ
jgi:hypothetical protein